MPPPILLGPTYWYNEVLLGGVDNEIKVISITGLSPVEARLASVPNPVDGGSWVYAGNPTERVITIMGHIQSADDGALQAKITEMETAFALRDNYSPFHFRKNNMQCYVMAKPTKFDYEETLEKIHSQLCRYAIQLIAGDPTIIPA